MNTEYYRIFPECVRTGNLTQAAENLGYTQSGISHIVALTVIARAELVIIYPMCLSGFQEPTLKHNHF